MKKIVFVALILVSIYARAGTCSANGTGNWETPGNWSCGHVPAAGDNVIIGAGITVTVNANNAANIGNLSISGTLHFTNGAKINLMSSSVVNVYSGGTINGGNGGAKLVFPSASYSGPFSTTGPFNFSNSGSGSGLLPLILTSFSCSHQNNEVVLYWATENEEDVDHFEIESSTKGNSDWQALEMIPSMAANGSGYSYTFIDHTIIIGDRYYRLKIFDKDGKYAFSKILFINSSETATHSIAVTLGYGSMNVVLPTHGQGQVSIFNISGQLIKSLTTGSEIFVVDITNLNKGIYFLRASQGTNLYSTKFFKQ